MKIQLVFQDWLNKNHESIYNTEKGIELSSGDFHSGAVFEATINCDDELELQNALNKGYRPVFYVVKNNVFSKNTNIEGNMTKQEFIDKYYSKHVPKWYKEFCKDLDSVIKSEIKRLKLK